ncbi:hypothetical protein SASPL_135449 [Salvia splendens]|uniref:Uncharacterized protein n=1 Tax=Salvia splendens TaxID=180675 RepID=A0A8X8ZFS9_SALSN|nr:hypothetical protein SASPL_135449 [Salvia splendens]
MEDSRIYGKTPFLAGSTMLTNDMDHENTMTDEKSYLFTRGVTVKTGVETSIKTKVPWITEAGIKVSFEISRSFQWDETTKTTTTVSASGTVPVPAKSRAVVDYVGTIGTCNIPFSYS